MHEVRKLIVVYDNAEMKSFSSAVVTLYLIEKEKEIHEDIISVKEVRLERRNHRLRTKVEIIIDREVLRVRVGYNRICIEENGKHVEIRLPQKALNVILTEILESLESQDEWEAEK